MSRLSSELRRGAYADSVVLMQLQSALEGLPGVLDAGVAMATETNLALLRTNGLLPPDLGAARPEDLLVTVRAESDEAAAAALGKIDELLARRSGEGGDEDYRPRSLRAAVKQLPEARWVLVSVPGRHAARLAGEALDLGRNVFLYSDNVPLEAEVALKRRAAGAGLVVMGPDCGTAVLGGVGLGFANRVRRGAVGLVGASGTGLQAIASRVHALGAGVSHALGTGGRDLSAEVGGRTARQALALLARDAETRVIVLVSKPPAPEVAARLLAAARAAGKPVVVDFLGAPPPARRLGPLHFAVTLAEAAERAVALLEEDPPSPVDAEPVAGHLRGLFSGGTLAQEAVLGLRALLPLRSNLAAAGVEPLADPTQSRGHAIVDLGADELTVGRLHPMIDPALLLERLRREAEDPETGLLLLDVVLGDGAHPDPAAGLAPAIAQARRRRPELEVVAVLVGTDEDPQGLDDQRERLEAAGARVFTDLTAAVEHVAARLAPRLEETPTVDASAIAAPVVAINAGLETFYDSLREQGASALQMDWRPPAGGDARLLEILKKLRGTG